MRPAASATSTALALLLSLPAGPQTVLPPASRPPSPPSEAQALQQSFERVAETIKPAVVSITTTRVETVEPDAFEFFLGPPEDGGPERGKAEHPAQAPRRVRRRLEGLGSGLIFDPRGYIATNAHVLEDAESIKVTVRAPDEREYDAKVVGVDPASDLAVLKIEARGRLPHAELGDSDAVKVGDWALAVGSPFGLEQTVTVGIVSALRQALRIENRVYSDFLQTDAAINHGNSGGPLVDIQGRVVGINTAIYAPAGSFSGIGFAIPSNNAREVLEQLVSRGKVARGWVGAELAPLDEVLAARFGVPDRKGALVNRVYEGSPALKAGLRRGDVITTFGGRKVDSPEGLVRLVARTKPGERITLRVVRDGRAREMPLETGARPDERPGPSRAAPPPESPSTWKGADLRSTSPEMNRRFELPKDAAGAVVTGLNPDSLAAEIGLREGDLIVGFDRRTVASLEDFLKAVGQADLKRGIVLDINRRGQPLYLTYRAGA